MIWHLLLVLPLLISAARVPECHDAELKRWVANIADVTIEGVGKLDERGRLWPELWRNPSQAAGCLIGQLRVVDVAVLQPDEKSNRDALRTLWSLRALRYLTGGKDFCGPTAHAQELDETRRQFLTIRCGPRGEVSFFGVWMSRDIVYFAPTDAQERIIQQWITWYNADGLRYLYTPARSLDDWYF
ncbi:MAG: hypothetical protein KatS3mg077_2905 [Candidatus Binatia bacterium]|nr:MAG: hypothetical protein KatS3mg077_2905 [Candidatus Binatia bacterium]